MYVFWGCLRITGRWLICFVSSGGVNFAGFVRSSYPHLLPDLARDFSSGSSLFLAALHSPPLPSSSAAAFPPGVHAAPPAPSFSSAPSASAPPLFPTASAPAVPPLSTHLSAHPPPLG